ncbi:MAG: phosphotransferase enzyme family protein [Rubrimonas sp.]
MAGLYEGAFLEGLRSGAERAAPDWGLSPETRVTLLTVSENATFRADDPARDRPVILRVHRPGYHTRAEIESELAWIDALRAEGAVDTPEPLPRRDGGRLAAFDHHGETRFVAAFAFMDGAEPAPDGNLIDGFRRLGAISARLHGHARRWAPPPAFARKRWDWSTTVGHAPHWGDWRAAPGLTPAGAATLERLAQALRADLAAFGDGPDRFGLIHADLRLANLLADGDRLGVIDFDDCGFGWFVYDFAAAVSFLEHEPFVPDLAAAWAEGYREVAPLTQAEEAAIPMFVALRRLLLTAWIASHPETPTAEAVGGAAYTQGTVAIADRYLSGRP